MRFFIFYVSMFCTSIGWTQTESIDNLAKFKITYEFDAIFKKESSNPIRGEYYKLLREAELVLLCNKSMCKSISPNTYDMDTHSGVIAAIATNAGGVYYEQLEPAKSVYQKVKGDDLYLLENQNRPVWEIQDSSIFINGIFCLYATGEIAPSKGTAFEPTQVTAWFAPEYPYPFGPQNITGLPGLILHATSNNIIYKVKSIEDVGVERLEMVAPSKGKRVSSITEIYSSDGKH